MIEFFSFSLLLLCSNQQFYSPHLPHRLMLLSQVQGCWMQKLWKSRVVALNSLYLKLLRGPEIVIGSTNMLLIYKWIYGMWRNTMAPVRFYWESQHTCNNTNEKYRKLIDIENNCKRLTKAFKYKCQILQFLSGTKKEIEEWTHRYVHVHAQKLESVTENDSRKKD